MSESDVLREHLAKFREDFSQLRQQIGKVLVGQQAAIDAVLTALVAGGHVLLEGPPGVGKTLLGRTLARVIDGDFRRIQFTSDLMPADVIGTYIVMESQGRRKFEFQQGPLFTNLLLADEVNRATPKTQAALLQAMDEREVAVANEVYELPHPFFVLATQSSNDAEGTFPLPENQLDRFFCRLPMPQLGLEELEAILEREDEPDPPAVEKIVDGPRLAEMNHLVRRLSVAADIRNYAARIVLATHPREGEGNARVNRFVHRGAGPRGAAAMLLAAKVQAILDERTYVAREDLAQVAPWSLGHRLALSFEGHAEGVDRKSIIQELLESVPRALS